MFRLVTIEREYGCGAAAIASQLADHLGWKLWDHLITEEIARLANVECAAVMRCEERMDSRLHRLAKSFWRGSYERNSAALGRYSCRHGDGRCQSRRRRSTTEGAGGSPA